MPVAGALASLLQSPKGSSSAVVTRLLCLIRRAESKPGVRAFVPMRCVFAIGSDVGWPVEVWALFSVRGEARRHADAAAYEFKVFPLPVYDSYDNYPRSLRPDAWNSAAMLRAVSEEADFARALAAKAPTSDATPVFAASDFESTRLPEVRALYETPTEAERHVAAAPGALSSLVMDVYASYDACPAEKRFDRPGPPLSQLIHPRR